MYDSLQRNIISFLFFGSFAQKGDQKVSKLCTMGQLPPQPLGVQICYRGRKAGWTD